MSDTAVERARELEAAFCGGFEMPGFYSTGAAWMNSDIRPLYMNGENATYLIMERGRQRTAYTRAERVPGRAISPREAYDAYAEGHRAGRELNPVGSAARERAMLDAWGRSDAYAAAHPGAALARTLRNVESATAARAQLALLHPQVAALAEVEQELRGIGNDQRKAARGCTAALAKVYQETEPVRALVVGAGPEVAEEIARQLRHSPSELGKLRLDASRADLDAAVAAAERLADLRRSAAAMRDWANTVVEPYRTARSYTPVQVAQTARQSLQAEIRVLEDIASAAPTVRPEVADLMTESWIALSPDEQALARVALPTIELKLAEADPRTSALVQELKQLRSHHELTASVRRNANLIEVANGVLVAVKEVRETTAQGWRRTEEALRPRFDNPDVLVHAIQRMDPEEILAFAAKLRENSQAEFQPATGSDLEPLGAARLKPVQEPGLRGFFGKISQLRTEREARIAATVLESWADVRVRCSLTSDWAASQLGSTRGSTLEAIQKEASQRYHSLLEINCQLIGARGALPPETHLDSSISRRVQGLAPGPAVVVHAAFPEVQTFLQPLPQRSVATAPSRRGISI